MLIALCICIVVIVVLGCEVIYLWRALAAEEREYSKLDGHWQESISHRRSAEQERDTLKAELARRDRDIEAMNMAAFRRGQFESFANVIADLKRRLDETVQEEAEPAEARPISPAEAKEIAHGILERAERHRDETAKAEAARGEETTAEQPGEKGTRDGK